MIEPLMTEDKGHYPVPVLTPTKGNSYQMAVTHTEAALIASPITERVIGIYSDQDTYIKFGSAEVVAASDNYDVMIPKGSYREFRVNSDAAYISALNLTSHGNLFINGLS